MKTKYILFVIVLVVLFAIKGCEEQPIPCVSYGEVSFTENYFENIQKDEIIFIKGMALDIYKYGRNIKVIEDLKGNFADKSTIFVWGIAPTDGRCGTGPPRWDYITLYNMNDTLIMILAKARKRFSGDVEKKGDYTTITLAYSILRLSNDTVTGVIYPWHEQLETWRGQVASWTELQEELNLMNKK